MAAAAQRWKIGLASSIDGSSYGEPCHLLPLAAPQLEFLQSCPLALLLVRLPPPQHSTAQRAFSILASSSMVLITVVAATLAPVARMEAAVIVFLREKQGWQHESGCRLQAERLQAEPERAHGSEHLDATFGAAQCILLTAKVPAP